MPWCVDRSIQLEDITKSMLSILLERVASVIEAVDGLNSRTLTSPMPGFCIVYSATKAAYFLLYQLGKKDQALAHVELDCCSPTKSKKYEKDFGFPVDSPPTKKAAAVTFDSSPVGGVTPPTTSKPSMPCGLIAGEKGWLLRCIYAEGVSPEQLDSMPAESRDLVLSSGTTFIGRHHQPKQFEDWLPVQDVRYLVSRSHVQIVTNGDSITVTNEKENMLNVDMESLHKGQSRAIGNGQVLSFCKKNENGTWVNFLMLQVRRSDSVVQQLAALQTQPRLMTGSSPKASTKSSAGSRSPTKRHARPTIVSGFGMEGEIVRTSAKALTLPAAAFAGALPQSPRRCSPGGQAARSPASRLAAPRSPGVSASPQILGNATTQVLPLRSTAAPTPKAATCGRDRSPTAERPGHNGGMYQLELVGGSASSVPVALRVLRPKETDAMFHVGPKSQADMFSSIFGKDQQVSKEEDCFCIMRLEQGQFWLAEHAVAGKGGSFHLMHISKGQTVDPSETRVTQLEDGDEVCLSRPAGGIASSIEPQLRFRFKKEAAPWWSAARSTITTVKSP